MQLILQQRLDIQTFRREETSLRSPADAQNRARASPRLKISDAVPLSYLCRYTVCVHEALMMLINYSDDRSLCLTSISSRSETK